MPKGEVYMKITRKRFALLLTVVLLLSVVFVPAKAEAAYNYIQYTAADTPSHQESFSQDLSNWTVSRGQIVNGRLQLGEVGSGDGGAKAILNTGNNLEDFVLEFDADFNQYFYRGISFRRQTNGNDYFWWFGANSVQIVKRISGSWQEIGTAHFPVALSGTHSFKLVVKGAQFETYVDGALYNTATDTTLK